MESPSSSYLLPRESAEFVMSNAEHVTIDEAALNKLASKLMQSPMKLNEFDLKKWKSDNPLHPQLMNEQTIDHIFFIDSLNFSFWPNNNENFSINGEVGYWSLCAAIKRALNENIPLINADYYSKMNLEQLKYIFRTDNGVEVPMLQERLEVLHENGSILLKHFNGSFVNCIRQCNSSAITLLRLIYKYFPTFRDEYCYKGKIITFMKRAQILIADIWSCFEASDFGTFTDIDQLTMFADYRIPQVLHYFGILNYSSELLNKLRNKHDNLLKYGEQYEIEIRASSIHAIELLRKQMKSMHHSDDHHSIPNSIQIDYYLWGYRRDNAEEIDRSPFHRVRCIFY